MSKCGIICKSGLWRGETKYRTFVSVIRLLTVMVPHDDIDVYYRCVLYFTISLYVFFLKFTYVKMKITKINHSKSMFDAQSSSIRFAEAEAIDIPYDTRRRE